MPAEHTDILLRDATALDLPAINAIYNYYVLNSTVTFDLEPTSLDDRRGWFAAHGERYPVVAETAGAVAGWCSLSRFHARPAYQWTAEGSVYLHPDWRGRGLGRRLLGEIVARAERIGYRAVVARIGDADNAASRALHAALGFQLVGIEREVGFKFGRWLDVVVMEWLAERRP